jgi:hypothetical protein
LIKYGSSFVDKIEKGEGLGGLENEGKLHLSMNEIVIYFEWCMN